MPKKKERALKAAIAADPLADAPRLAYADWLEDKDPDLGEFIRLEIERERMPEDDPRYDEVDERTDELMDEHWERWSDPLVELGLEREDAEGNSLLLLDRGLVHAVTVTAEGIFPERAEALFEAAPALRELTFHKASSPDPVQLLTSPFLDRLTSLTVISLGFDESAMRKVGPLRYGKRLTHLYLNSNPIGAVGVEAIRGLSALEELQLDSCALGEAAATALAAAAFTGLHTLLLSNNDLGPEGLAALSAASFRNRVRCLTLGDNDLGPDGMDELAAWSEWTALDQLQLPSNRIGAEGLAALARARHLKQLTYLDCSLNQLEDDGVEAFASAPHWTSLRTLDLGNNRLGPGAAKALAASPHFPELRVLAMGSNELGDLGMEYLARGPGMPALGELKLRKAKVGERGMQALASSRPNLTYLDLRENPLGAAGARALAAAKWESLTELLVTAELVEEENLLAERFGEVIVQY